MQHDDDDYKDLTDGLGDFAEAWKPDKPGDTLVGRVTDVGTNNAGFGEYVILSVRQPNGERLAWHAFGTVAASEVAKAKPEPGDRIAIMYGGKVRGRQDQEYVRYSVRVGKPGGPTGPDYDAIAQAAAAQEAIDGDAEPVVDFQF